MGHGHGGTGWQHFDSEKKGKASLMRVFRAFRGLECWLQGKRPQHKGFCVGGCPSHVPPGWGFYLNYVLGVSLPCPVPPPSRPRPAHVPSCPARVPPTSRPRPAHVPPVSRQCPAHVPPLSRPVPPVSRPVPPCPARVPSPSRPVPPCPAPFLSTFHVLFRLVSVRTGPRPPKSPLTPLSLVMNACVTRWLAGMLAWIRFRV